MANDKVVHIGTVDKSRITNEPVFVMCNCKPHDPVPMHVIALGNPDGSAFIATLICSECEKEVPVCNGVINCNGQ